MDKISKYLNSIIKTIVIISFGIMVVVTFAQIFYRYVLLRPIPWAEELARFLFVWITFLGASVAVRNKAHVGVEVLISKFPKKTYKRFLSGAYILCAIFCALMAYNGFIMLKRISTQTSAAMGMPMSVPYLAVPVGFTLMVMNFLFLAYEEIMGKSVEIDDLEELLKQE